MKRRNLEISKEILEIIPTKLDFNQNNQNNFNNFNKNQEISRNNQNNQKMVSISWWLNLKNEKLQVEVTNHNNNNTDNSNTSNINSNESNSHRNNNNNNSEDYDSDFSIDSCDSNYISKKEKKNLKERNQKKNNLNELKDQNLFEINYFESSNDKIYQQHSIEKFTDTNNLSENYPIQINNEENLKINEINKIFLLDVYGDNLSRNSSKTSYSFHQTLEQINGDDLCKYLGIDSDENSTSINIPNADEIISQTFHESTSSSLSTSPLSHSKTSSSLNTIKLSQSPSNSLISTTTSSSSISPFDDFLFDSPEYLISEKELKEDDIIDIENELFDSMNQISNENTNYFFQHEFHQKEESSKTINQKKICLLELKYYLVQRNLEIQLEETQKKLIDLTNCFQIQKKIESIEEKEDTVDEYHSEFHFNVRTIDFTFISMHFPPEYSFETIHSLNLNISPNIYEVTFDLQFLQIDMLDFPIPLFADLYNNSRESCNDSPLIYKDENLEDFENQCFINSEATFDEPKTNTDTINQNENLIEENKDNLKRDELNEDVTQFLEKIRKTIILEKSLSDVLSNDTIDSNPSIYSSSSSFSDSSTYLSNFDENFTSSTSSILNHQTIETNNYEELIETLNSDENLDDTMNDPIDIDFTSDKSESILDDDRWEHFLLNDGNNVIEDYNEDKIRNVYQQLLEALSLNNSNTEGNDLNYADFINYNIHHDSKNNNNEILNEDDNIQNHNSEENNKENPLIDSNYHTDYGDDDYDYNLQENNFQKELNKDTFQTNIIDNFPNELIYNISETNENYQENLVEDEDEDEIEIEINTKNSESSSKKSNNSDNYLHTSNSNENSLETDQNQENILTPSFYQDNLIDKSSILFDLLDFNDSDSEISNDYENENQNNIVNLITSRESIHENLEMNTSLIDENKNDIPFIIKDVDEKENIDTFNNEEQIENNQVLIEDQRLESTLIQQDTVHINTPTEIIYSNLQLDQSNQLIHDDNLSIKFQQKDASKDSLFLINNEIKILEDESISRQLFNDDNESKTNNKTNNKEYDNESQHSFENSTISSVSHEDINMLQIENNLDSKIISSFPLHPVNRDMPPINIIEHTPVMLKLDESQVVQMIINKNTNIEIPQTSSSTLTPPKLTKSTPKFSTRKSENTPINSIVETPNTFYKSQISNTSTKKASSYSSTPSDIWQIKRIENYTPYTLSDRSNLNSSSLKAIQSKNEVKYETSIINNSPLKETPIKRLPLLYKWNLRTVSSISSTNKEYHSFENNNYYTPEIVRWNMKK